MFQRTSAICALTIGMAALTWGGRRATAAALPDAPSAVKAAQRLRASIVTGFGDGATGGGDAVYLVNAEAAAGRRFFLLSNEVPAADFSSSSVEGQPISRTGLAVSQPGPTTLNPCPQTICSRRPLPLCCGYAPPTPFDRFLKRPGVVPLTARDNLHAAIGNVFDPFNLMTVAVDSGVSVASNPDSPYGPGAKGFAKYAGVGLTEAMTGEFFGTFLIPSLMHQDPHYHRQPFVSMERRILHTVTQVFWAQSYDGQPMLNYGNIFGGIATAVISNTFVPGPGRQGFSNTSKRLALAFAFSPVGNMIEEFLPDIANRINLRVVIFQRILNSVSFKVTGVQ